jgi:hypothetical protein
MEDSKDPSAEASTLGGRFYSDVWMKGGREMVDETIRKNEKESHDTQVEMAMGTRNPKPDGFLPH